MRSFGVNEIKLFCKNCILSAKYLSYRFFRIVTGVFNIFPVRDRRILFISYNGRQYSDNPRAISEGLYKNYGNTYEYIWAFQNPDIVTVPTYVKKIKTHSLSFIYYFKTSSVIIKNARMSGSIAKRKGQYQIQTWHASNGYKKIRGDVGVRGKISRLDCKDYDYVCAGCENMVNERIHGTFGFYGPIIKGTPRMDEVIHPQNITEIEHKVLEYCGLDKSVKIALYAPTYRNSNQNSFGLHYDKTIDYLEKKFGGKWILLVRMHYFVKSVGKASDRIIDVSGYPDIVDLLLCSDILISDYSSCIWDFSFTNKPCFLFCSDLSTYSKTVNFNIPIDKWGFPVATSMEKLEENIDNYSVAEYEKALKTHHEQMGSFEDGYATQRVCELIRKLC